jgi:hypothetical protein
MLLPFFILKKMRKTHNFKPRGFQEFADFILSEIGQIKISDLKDIYDRLTVKKSKEAKEDKEPKEPKI